MTLKLWREIAVPHEDVLKGTFQQAELAADLLRVHDGTNNLFGQCAHHSQPNGAPHLSQEIERVLTENELLITANRNGR